MKRTILLAMLLGSAVAVTPAANAQTGFLCGFVSITDPTVEGDVQTGEMDGGPLAAADVDNSGEEAADISIRCTIQVGAQGATHAGADAYSAEGPTTVGVAVLAPHQFSYVAPEGAPVYLCTEAQVNGQIRYFNETEDDATRGWSTSSSSACALAISQEVDPAPAGPFDGVMIIAPADGSEPIHFNVDGWDCSNYTWTPGTGVYDVSCTSTGSACTSVTVAVAGATTGSSFCTGGPVATAALAGGAGGGAGGTSPWHCVGTFPSTGGVVHCTVTVTV